MKLPAAMAAKTASGSANRYGRSIAASATTPATATDASAERLTTALTISGSKTSVPASASPQSSGNTLASRMPTIDDACQDTQLSSAIPQKYPSFPGT